MKRWCSCGGCSSHGGGVCRALVDRGRCAGCERAWQASRNARPERAIYGGAWKAESRHLRHEQPWCSVCGTPRDLTVDHPTRAVLCRSHHATLENERRAITRGASR